MKWSIRGLLAFSVPYGFVLASLYLLAYWPTVGLNPFHYSNAADLVSATMGSVVIGIAASLLGVLIGLLSNPRVSRDPSTSKPTRARRIEVGLLYAVVIALVVILWWLDRPAKWGALGLLIMVSLPPFLRHHHLFNTAFPDAGAKALVVALISMVPFTFYSLGKIAIHTATTPGLAMQVDMERSETGVTASDPVLYVGMLGDYHVLFESGTKSTILVHESSRLVLSKSRN